VTRVDASALTSTVVYPHRRAEQQLSRRVFTPPPLWYVCVANHATPRMTFSQRCIPRFSLYRCLCMQPDVEGDDGASGRLSSRQLQCLRWLQVNVVEAPATSLTTQQLQELRDAVGDDVVSCAAAMPLVRRLCTMRHCMVCVAGARSHGDGCGCDDAAW
jgi:hypothetical protein